MAFVATNKTPGVYIDEIQLPGPIPGVSTSNVAIVGPAEMGPTNVPTLITNPTQFADTFGGYIYSPHIVQATHAVHGFFRNGGTTCYFVRIGTAQASRLELVDDSTDANVTLVVTAKADGPDGDLINVQVIDDPIVQDVKIDFASGFATTLTEPTAGDKAKVADISGLTVGDSVKMVGVKADDSPHAETATIDSIDAPTKELTFDAALGDELKAATVQLIVDLSPTGKTLKVEDIKGIEPGTSLEIDNGTNDEMVVVQSISKSTRMITLESGLKNDYASGTETNVTSNEFTIKVGASESFDKMSMDSRHSRHFKTIVDSTLVEIVEPDQINPTPAPDNRPVVVGPSPLADGAIDDIATHALAHYAAGIKTLEKVDEVNMLCVPDGTDSETHGLMVEHCEKLAERFAILDPPADASDVTKMMAHRDLLQSDRGFAALYFPRIKIRDPNPNFDRLIPVSPSGHLAGVYARTDNDKGVHKVPANEVIKGVVEVEHTLTETDAGILNEKSVNILRFFRGKGFRIWGGRTIASGTQWRYINVRRLMLFIEESIQEASEQFVFDPNNLSLWKTIERQVNGFLTGVWQNGALFGATAKQAFRVRIDEELNPPAARALGILTVEIVVFPTTPAEYIVFRVIQEPGGPRLVEI